MNPNSTFFKIGWRSLLVFLGKIGRLGWNQRGVITAPRDGVARKANGQTQSLSCPLEVSPQKGKRADAVNGMRAVEELDFGAVRNA